jgi:hypothetical protein
MQARTNPADVLVKDPADLNKVPRRVIWKKRWGAALINIGQCIQNESYVDQNPIFSCPTRFFI